MNREEIQKEQIKKVLQKYYNTGLSTDEAIDKLLSLISNKEEEKEWLDFNEHTFALGERPNIEIKFESGETCMYNDEWPFDEATHWRRKN